MVSKEELEKILSTYYVISPPRHVFMLEKPAVAFTDGLAFFKGLAPSWRRDVAIITPQGNDETVLHEVIHNSFGLSEVVTDRAAKVMIMKHRLMERRPLLKSLTPKRKVHYEVCQGCQLCRDLSSLLIRSPKGASPQHLILKEE